MLSLLSLEVVVNTVSDSTANQEESVEADTEAAGRGRRGGRGGRSVSGLRLGVTGLENVSLRFKEVMHVILRMLGIGPRM